MTHITSTIVALKTTTLIFGALITYFAWKAYQRTQADALQPLAIGFGVVTIGSILAGAIDHLVPVNGTYALMADSALTAVGFAIILYSLYAE